MTYCAEQLFLLADYFGDLIKRETCSSALDYIQSKLIEEAKMILFDHEKSVSDIAKELGFKYQQHFTRLFKQKTRLTPLQYRINALLKLHMKPTN